MAVQVALSAVNAPWRRVLPAVTDTESKLPSRAVSSKVLSTGTCEARASMLLATLTAGVAGASGVGVDSESGELAVTVQPATAKKKPVDEVSVSDLGLSGDDVGLSGANQEITNVAAAPAREAGEKIEDDGTGHERIVEFLAQLKVI